MLAHYAVFGALPVASGKILLDGQPYTPSTPTAAMRVGIGSVPEDRHGEGIFTELSVRENLSITVLGKFWKQMRSDRRLEKANSDALVKEYAVRTGSIEQPISTLSGGNQQKVVIARWLQRQPRVLLLDEPTQGVDVVARSDIYHSIASATRTGTAVIVASSDLDELLALSNRIVVMRDGVAVGEFDATTVTRERIARLMMADDPTTLTHTTTPATRD